MYCADPEACNYNEMGDCSYHGSRKDCDGNALYCTDPVACNYNEMGDCSYHGSRKDCDGNALYCTDPVACNYNEMGECTYHGSRTDCKGNKIYCDDDDACNTGSMNDCQYPPDGLDCEGNCDNSAATNYGQYGSCDFVINTIEEYFANYGDYLDISEPDNNGFITYKLKQDFEFNSANINMWYGLNYILSNVIFNGNNKTITIDLGTDNNNNNIEWEGLFKPKNISDGTFKIKNLT